MGIQGDYFWAAVDNDGSLNGQSGGQDEIQTIAWSDITINGKTGLIFKGLFATGETTTFDHGTSTLDPDFLYLEYRIDGGNWLKLIDFRPNKFNQSNGALALDLDNDGLGDGTALTNDFVEFSAPIIGTGNSIELKIYVRSNTLGEEIAFDNFRLFTQFML